MDQLVNRSLNESLAAMATTASTPMAAECTSMAMKFNDATVIVSVIVLGLINVIVIAGNILVIVSVFVSAKLRTVTNFFIVSLAVADLLVGIAVIPYSLSLEILDVWVFGEIWCQGWLVIDVWMCTASILNLCAISIDRYLAVTRPVRYRSMMTSKRAKIVIGVVWVLSFIICLPPLIGWNDTNTSFIQSSGPPEPMATDVVTVTDSHLTAFIKQTEQTIASSTSVDVLNTSSVEVVSGVSATTSATVDRSATNSIVNSIDTLLNQSQPTNEYSRDCFPARTKCALFQNKGYVIYSALGSFYIPMFVMVFFYWRIYLVASHTSRALARGYKTTKCNGSHDERLTLRIHRGIHEEGQSGGANASTYLSVNSDSSALNTTTTFGATAGKPRSPNLRHTVNESCDQNQTKPKRVLKESKSVSGAGGPTAGGGQGKKMPITLYRSSRLTTNSTLSPATCEQNGQNNRRMSPSNQSTLSIPSSSSPCSSREGSARSGKLAMSRFSKRTSKYQAKRFHAETKAAKTVGIIVGGFILCWLPFFTIYLARAFFVIPDILLSIFIWLGYCNSMINPCIYGLFSKDFRRAFRNILCRCKFREETVSSLIRQIHMPTFFEDMPEDTTKPDSQDD